MARKEFMPRSDDKRRDWLNNFVDVLQDGTNGLAAKYKIDNATVAQLDQGRQWVVWTLSALAVSRQSTQGFTGFKDNLFGGNAPITAPVPPVFVKVPGTPPTSGVFVFAASIAGQIKKAPNYDVADGDLLGIEGAEQVMPDPATTAPAISTRTASGGLIEIVWKKDVFDGVKLEVDRGDGWKYLATDTVPNYLDTFKPAPGTSAVYKYRAIYLLHDAEYGQRSNVAEATAKG